MTTTYYSNAWKRIKVFLKIVFTIYAIISMALVTIGLSLSGFMHYLFSNPQPKANDILIQSRLDEQFKNKPDIIIVSALMPDEIIGFHWDEVCRGNSFNYSDPVYADEEWFLSFHQDKCKNLDKQPEHAYYLINSIKFGNGLSKDTPNDKQSWCVDRENAVLQVTDSGVLLTDMREIKNK